MNNEDLIVLNLIKYLLNREEISGDVIPEMNVNTVTNHQDDLSNQLADYAGSNHELDQLKEQVSSQMQMLQMTIEHLSAEIDRLEAENQALATQENSQDYLRFIQKATFDSEDDLKMILPNSFALQNAEEAPYKNFFWIREKNGLIYLIVAACTGEGMSGISLATVCNNFANHFVPDRESGGDCQTILKDFQRRAQKSLDNHGDFEFAPQLEVGICVIDKLKAEMEFCGSEIQMLVVENNEIKSLKGANKNSDPQKHSLKIRRGSNYYLVSNQYQSRMAAASEASKLDEVLLKMKDQDFSSQRAELKKQINMRPLEDSRQTDVLLLGFGF